MILKDIRMKLSNGYLTIYNIMELMQNEKNNRHHGKSYNCQQ